MSLEGHFFIIVDEKTYKGCLYRANEGFKFTFYLICQHQIIILIYANTH